MAWRGLCKLLHTAWACTIVPMTSSIADLRKSYERAELNEDASHAAPLQQFDQWLKEAIASEVPEPNAMTVATVGSDMRPSTRVVLIKGFDERGIVWFTNYDSRKGRQIAGNPYVALQFHWVELERVVRIEGIVEKVSDAESDEYFASRPLDSRIGACIRHHRHICHRLARGRARELWYRHLLNRVKPCLAQTPTRYRG